MRPSILFGICSLLSACAAQQSSVYSSRSHANMSNSPTTERPEDRWDLTQIYPSDEAWQQAYNTLEKDISTLKNQQNTFVQDGAHLASTLEQVFDIDKTLSRIYGYASKRSDEDTRQSAPLSMRQKAHRLATLFAEQTSFIEPGLLKLGKEKINRFVGKEPRLLVYQHYLDNVLRRAPHTRSAEEESLIASSSLLSDTASTVYNIFANAELPWPTITLSTGETVRLDQSTYGKYRTASNRKDRQAVFQAFWGTWKQFEQTTGVTLYAQLKRDLYYKQVRNYGTCLETALDRDNIPQEVYRTLIQSTHENLATLHRYFKLRGRMLGIKDLKYYDIYPSLVDKDDAFSIEHGKNLVLEAVQPLGPDYVSAVKNGFDNRWMDTFPRQGKRSGAYSSGAAYDVHPYVLMNYNGDYESVNTLAHEWGHAMHSYLANKAQPYPTADYSIFLAEIASTFNEALLLDTSLKNAKTEQDKLFYLGSALEGLRGTFFRQTMFAEFELAIHEAVEKGEALTGEQFSKIYGNLLRQYHGHNEGVLTVDDLYNVEWAYIPHFYSGFYVYQYATSIAAASLLADDVMKGVPGAKDRYLGMLAKGGAEYPYTLLKETGVDLASKAPYQSLFARMNRIMDAIENILDHRN